MPETLYDVAIIGAGPAGLQAALVLARTRKKIVVFSSPQLPRNHASHGVHNLVGLDGLLPTQIQAQAWQQIEVYGSAELRAEHIVDIQPVTDSKLFKVLSENNQFITAQQVILAVGFRDIHPDISGFEACWGKTIIPCPFCDGYENRDRVWGLVLTTPHTLEHMPLLFKNWTSTAKVILSPNITLSPEQQEILNAHQLAIHRGEISLIHHTDGEVEAVTLDTGEQVAVETLWWTLPETPTELTQRVSQNFELALDEKGHIQTDANHQTAVQGLWVVGDVKGWVGALGAAFTASQAATIIVKSWYD